MLNGYILYALLGYVLSTTKLKKKCRIVIYIFGVVGVLIRLLGTYYLSARDGAINKMFFGNIEYYTFFWSMAVFVFVKHSKILARLENNNKVCKIFSKLSSVSFGVYLTHMIVLTNLKLYIDSGTYAWRLLVPILIYCICLVIVIIIKKIPVMKHIIP